MLRQIRYFQAVVQNNSFSRAAEECHISQSAISQQIQALERELGFSLLERSHRTFSLTPAGEYFYQKSLILTADCERICAEAAKIARDHGAVLKIGCLREYTGREFQRALQAFAAEYPEVTVEIARGNHEELYQLLRTGQADLVLNDQRRAFSDEYVNLVLTAMPSWIEVSASSPLACLSSVTPADMKNTPCILVASPAQRETERAYHHDVVGFQGEFLFAENVEEARLLVASGRGFLPAEGRAAETAESVIRQIPLCRNGKQIARNLCAFWRVASPGEYTEAFGELLRKQFASE